MLLLYLLPSFIFKISVELVVLVALKAVVGGQKTSHGEHIASLGG
jgi:hypothetical protein